MQIGAVKCQNGTQFIWDGEFWVQWNGEFWVQEERNIEVSEFSSFVSRGEYKVQVHNDAISPLFDTIDPDDFDDVIELLTECKKLQEKYKKAVAEVEAK